MAVLQKRVVISKGKVAKPGDVHLGEAATKTERVVLLPKHLNLPLQQVWWAPLSSLKDLAEFAMIKVERGRAAANKLNWDQSTITVKAKKSGPAKIAIQVYATTAESVDHTANRALTEFEGSKLHTNLGAAAAVTLTLPAAAQNLKQLEYYFEVKVAQNLEIRPNGNDKIVDVGIQRDFARSNTVNDRLVLETIDAGLWRVADRTPTWVFA